MLVEKSERPKVSIGIPVYNGEKFITNRIDSIFNQTFKDFELIISDNASTDVTEKICLDYVKKYNQIKYFRQKTNIGAQLNFEFVLKKAKGDYFMWAAVDDLIEPCFLEKNIQILENNFQYVGSTGKSKLYHLNEEKSIDSNFSDFRNKIIKKFRPSGTYAITGTYEKKVRTFLKRSAYQVIYGVFRTNVLKKSLPTQQFVGDDGAIILNVLKYGDIHVFDEILIKRYEYGYSTRGSLSLAKNFNKNLIGKIFPHIPLTVWFIKNIGLIIFIKNLDHFILLNMGGEVFVIIDIIKILSKKIKRNDIKN